MKKIATPFIKALRGAVAIPPEKRLVVGASTLFAYGKPYLFLEVHWYQKRYFGIIKKVLLDVVVLNGRLQRCISIDAMTYIEEATFEELVGIAQKQLSE